MTTWAIEPLPDFLVDHTLTGHTVVERLREVVSRWVQWVGSLWGLGEHVLFGLRFSASKGRIRIFFEAHHHPTYLTGQIDSQLGVLLRAHRLGSGMPLPPPDRDENRLYLKPGSAVVEMRQYQTTSLWAPHSHALKSDEFRKPLAWLPENQLREPALIYPWWAPGGPFLIPMESLISQPVPVEITVFLRPTILQAREWMWLSLMAREAQSKGEQNLHALGTGAAMRITDPAASLAGRLYMANLRRLSNSPFMVAVYCAAADSRTDVAANLAGTLQSLVHELPFDRPQQDDERLPSGAELRPLGKIPTTPFPEPSEQSPLCRLPYLVDARGAALAFRLPVSVRGGVPGMQVRQLSPDFHPGARTTERPAGCLKLGSYEAGGDAYFPVADLAKHALITGFTGSGKTVTVLQLLHQLWADHRVPFLVLESAKQEYRGLFGVDRLRQDLRVYTLGNELAVPFRMNPFQLLPGVRVEAHLSKLQTCFEGAIPPIGPSSSVIAEALLTVYENSGWNLTDVYPLAGESKRRFPMLSDFVDTVGEIIERRGYEGEVRSNLMAALVGRFKPLLFGSKGRMFDTQRSQPNAAGLFARPTVLEMNDLNLDDKALVVMFVLTILREHRERDRGKHGELKHVTMVEEAHNVLENVASKGGGEGATSADTRFKAVEAFCQLLTEIRALGEGLVIADQSPEKLARDAMRNTNLQIAHQLRDGHDREAIANAMIMEKEQRDFLGKLVPGQAAPFRTGLEKATFIRVDKYYPTEEDCCQAAAVAGAGDPVEVLRQRFLGFGFNPELTDAQLATTMEHLELGARAVRRLSLPFRGCSYCRSQCSYRDALFEEVRSSDSGHDGATFRRMFCNEEGVTATALWRWIASAANRALDRAGCQPDPDAGWCFFVHIWDSQFDCHDSNKQLDHECYDLFVSFFNEALIPP